MKDEELEKLVTEFKRMMDTKPIALLAVVANQIPGTNEGPLIFLANGGPSAMTSILLTACGNCPEIKSAVMQAANVLRLEKLTGSNKTIN